MNNLLDQIDAYLDGTMNATDRAAFETKMTADASLREQVNTQQNLRAGIERLGMKAATAQTFKKISLKSKLYKWGVATVAVAAIATSAYLINNPVSSSTGGPEITYELPATNEEGGTEWSDADRNLPTQLFTINPAKDTVIETIGGIVFAIPAGAFVGGKVPMTLEIREALTPMDIMKGGLSTTSNGELLETGGMFYINARNGETSLAINPDKPVYANVPTNEIRPGMQLFEGERTADGGINWVNPKQMEKQLIPVDIFSLNFYPDGFEEKCAELGFDANDRNVTDSIYYSYAGRVGQMVSSGTTVGTDHGNVDVDGNDSARVRHVLIAFKGAASASPDIKRTKQEALALANDIKQRVDAGSLSMASAVNQYTDDPGSKSGNNGDYGWITGESGFVKPYLYSAFGYQIGSTNVFETDFGYHIMEILDQRFHDEDSNEGERLEIDPARISAIQTSEFQNTILATKEFEERLKLIFEIGDPAILDLYVNNLDKKMYAIDSLVIARGGAESSNDLFLKFYDRHDGGVAISQSHMKELQEYYQKKQEAVRIASQKTYDARTGEQRKQDSIYEENWISHENDVWQGRTDNFDKEYEINLKEAYKQLDLPWIKRTDSSYVIPNDSYSFNIRTTGWCNVDAFVWQSTMNRTTLDYTDPLSGKKAVIKYEALNINIQDVASYSQVMVYLVTDSLPCFMRVLEVDGAYSEKLNELLDYSLVVMAEKDGTWYSATSSAVTPGSVNVSLKATDESSLRNSMNSQFGGSPGTDFNAEVNYMKETHRFNVRRAKEKKQHEIDAQIMKVIFPFYVDEGYEEWIAPSFK